MAVFQKLKHTCVEEFCKLVGKTRSKLGTYTRKFQLSSCLGRAGVKAEGG
jgi:hypothetical protein